MSVDMKSLRQQLNPVCLRGSRPRPGCASSGRIYEITVEHMVGALLDMGSTDLMCICDKFKLDVSKLRRRTLNRCLDELKIGNSGRPQYFGVHGRLAQPGLAGGIAGGWAARHPQRRAGLGLAEQPDRAFFTDDVEEWKQINEHELKKTFATSPPRRSRTPRLHRRADPVRRLALGSSDWPGRSSQPTSRRARAGKVDPVIGREARDSAMRRYSMRRYQNNPFNPGRAGHRQDCNR